MLNLRDVFTGVGRFIQARPLVTLLLAVALIGLAMVGAAQIQSVTGNEAFVEETQTLNQFDDSFDRGGIAVLVRGEVTDPGTMRAIDRFDRRVSEIDDIEVVDSPADQLRREYGDVPDSQAAIERVVDADEQVILTAVIEPGVSQEESRPIYDKTVDAREWAAFPSGVSVTITGQPAYSTQLTDAIQENTRQSLGLAVGLMAVALFFLFRGVRLRLLPLVAVFTGVIWTFGAIGFAGVPNSTLTSAVFPILIGLGIDYSVQFHERYEEELDRYPPRKALPRALGGIGPAVCIAMVSAALGFAATWLSTLDSPAFVWFAQTSIFGVMLTFLAGIIVLLPILTLYARWRGGPWTTDEDAASEGPSGDGPGPASGSSQDDEETGLMGRTLGRTSRATASHPILVLGIAILLMAGGFQASSDLGSLTDPDEFFPQDLPAYVDLQEFQSATGGGTDVEYDVLVTGERLQDPDVLRWMDRFADVASDKPLVTDVTTPADHVRSVNGGSLPATEAGVSNALERIPEQRRDRLYDDGLAHIRVTAEQDMNTDEQLSFIETVESALSFSQPPPGVDASLTGLGVVATPNIVEQIEERNVTTAFGIAFVFLALLLYYRSLLRAVAPLIPMLFVIGWQNLYMAALSIPVSPLGASLGAMSVGIGAEYTIIVMERYFEETERGVPRLEAIETAGARVGKAITVSGMTTVFGFSALTLSPFPILADFGFLTVGVIFLTLVAAITTLPPTLLVLGRLRDATLSLAGRTEPVESPAD